MQIRQPDDFHVHLRDGDMLRRMVPLTARDFRRALVMPNTTRPILTAADADAYHREISNIAGYAGRPHFTPLMTIKLTSATTPDIIAACRGTLFDLPAAKLYPEGVTTNSTDGVSNFEAMYPVFAQMEKQDMVLCLHGESPGVCVLDREEHFLKTLIAINRNFPKLRIILEHVTTEAAVETVRLLPDTVAATITVHHLFLTIDDIMGGMLKPHFFCKPVAKRESDRLALVRAALSGNPKFFLGTDSAPHLVERKECESGCAGIFTAPVAIPCLAEFFETESALEKLEDFTSTFGARFYRYPENETQIELVKQPNMVPVRWEGVVPFRAGTPLAWKVVT